MKFIRGLITFILAAVMMYALFMAGSEVQQVPPNNVIILVDHKYKTFISPECLSPNKNYETEEYEPLPLNVARDELDYKFDSECTYSSLWPSRNSLINYVGVKTGLLKPIGWKWNEDGTWKKEVFQ